MKVERNRVGNKYTFKPEEKKDEEFLDKVYKKIDEIEEENKKLREENEMLRCSKCGTPEKVGHEEMIQYLMEENKKLKKENEELKEYKSMYEKLVNNLTFILLKMLKHEYKCYNSRKIS